MPHPFHDRKAGAVTILGDHESLRTGPEYPSLISQAKQSVTALNTHLFSKEGGPLAADHPLRRASIDAYGAVINHLEKHNPSARGHAEVMDRVDPLEMKALSDLNSTDKAV